MIPVGTIALHGTRFSANGETLKYGRVGKNWRFFIVETNGNAAEVGPAYSSKDELLSDLYRYATSYGFKG